MRILKALSATLVLPLAAALTLAGCSDPAPSEGDVTQIGRGGEEVVIGLTYVPNVQFAPVYVAASEQIFKNAGVGAAIRHHGTDEGLFTALVNGEEDVTVASGDEVLQARAAGMDLVSIGAYYDQYPVALIAAADANIETLEDLEGKSVGVPGEFGSNWFGLLAALDTAGLTLADVNVVSVGFTQAASLASGAVDVVVGFVNSEPVQLEQMDFDFTVLPLADYQVPLVGASIVTTRTWLDSHPELAESTVLAIVAGMDRVIANPQRALEVAALWDTSIERGPARATGAAQLAATIPLWDRGDGRASAIQDLETWERMGPFLSQILDVPETDMGAATAVTNEFASR